MSFIYPLGLLGLLGIPVVIIIYIIKSKYTEQTIPTTYLWTLSEKFLKKKKTHSRLTGIISLILQILIITVISLSIANPVITLSKQAREYCFIIDGSGSMNVGNAGVTRLDLAKDEVRSIISSSKDGSIYNIMYCGESIRAYEDLNDKDSAIDLLDTFLPNYTASDCVDSLKYAQNYFNENQAIQTYLITDKQYNVSNINLINVSDTSSNYAVLDTTYNIVSKNVDGHLVDSLNVSGNVISYGSDADLNVNFYVNNELVEQRVISVNASQKTPFVFESSIVNYDSVKVCITNSDDLMVDNEYIIYNVVKEHLYNILLVSDYPFYLETVLSLVGNALVTVIPSSDYSSDIKGYGLYIFDSCNPKELPSDGSIWLFNLSSNLPEAGFAYQDVVELEDGAILEYESSTYSLYRELTDGILQNEISICKFMKYGLYRDFTTILSYDGYPVVFAGTNNFNKRQIVFAFDLHNSNLPLLLDFGILIDNFIDYSFPTIIEEANYVCGDTLTLNVVSDCTSIRVESPNGNISYMDIGGIISEFVLSEAGSYKIIVSLGESEKVFNVYVSLPDEEGNNEELDILDMELTGEVSDDYIDGYYDKLIIFFIVLVVIFMADWVVYSYEQHQLR